MRMQHSRIRVAVVAPSLRYVGGQSVQADLLLRNWKDDPDVDARFVPVDPRLPFGLRWVERVPFLRTVIREPFYALIALESFEGSRRRSYIFCFLLIVFVGARFRRG